MISPRSCATTATSTPSPSTVAQAANLFRRHVLPTLPVEYRQLRMLQMPSTSPAHARLRLAEKLVKWQTLAQEEP